MTVDATRTAPRATRELRTAAAGSDLLLVGVTTILGGLGLVLVYSASAVFAAKVYHGDAQHFLVQQAGWALAGLAAMAVAMRVSSATLMRWAPWLLLGCMALCVAVLVPGLGKFVNGAHRRLAVGAVGFQPAELCKLAVILALARVLARREKKDESARGSLLGPVILVQVPVLLVLVEPDLGTALVIEGILAVMVFAAGVRLRTLALLALCAMPVLYGQVMGTEFRLKRMLSYLDPWAYRSTIGYQITESLISIGSGGVFGVGLGGGKQKLFFLPEAHTDFIFSILGEELGLLGIVLVLGCFVLLVWRGLRIAERARSPFDAYLALGVTALIGVPALFNAGVATGLLPTKGLSLPFVSYGGSNLVVSFVAIGILLRLGREQGGAQRRAGAEAGGTGEHAIAMGAA
jgi:cell division protein FtsW